MAKNYEKSIRAFLGEGTEFKGVISFEGTVRVDGVLEGEVITDDTFIIGTAAQVKAYDQGRRRHRDGPDGGEDRGEGKV